MEVHKAGEKIRYVGHGFFWKWIKVREYKHSSINDELNMSKCASNV